MSHHSRMAAPETAGVEVLIDPGFYGREAGLAFGCAAEAARHFLAIGQAQGLSPSPFLLWGWMRGQGAAPSGFSAFLEERPRICVHPALDPDAFFGLWDAAAGDLAKIAAVLSRLDVGRAPLLRGFREAARAGRDGSLAGFFSALSARHPTDAPLEMPLFSSSWYVDAYEDVALGGLNPFPHYVIAGWAEGRDPSPAFSTALYLERHPDVRRGGLNPLIHYLDVGRTEARRVEGSTAYPDIVRHAFKRGRLPAEYVPFESDDAEAIGELCENLDGTELVIVVPFFRNEALADVVCPGLLDCADELKALKACVLLVNDSPDHAPLRVALEAWAARLGRRGFAVVLFEMKRNAGFIGATNVGLRCADLLSCACLMLNSDTRLKPGSLSEMVAVAALDDRFAFVSPLSNNATIATLGLACDPDTAGAAARHAAVAEALPRHLVVPTCVGFCLLVRREVIELFGYLDPAYGRGYNEENDYIMRANRKGYLSVLAPRAFASHVGQQSFSTVEANGREREAPNRAVLLGRYPEYETAVERYFASPQSQARRLVERYPDSVDLLVDLGNLPGVANGTSVLARELVPRLIRRVGPERCAVRASVAHLDWLGLSGFTGLQHWEPDDRRCAKVGLRLSQPYRRDDVAFLSSHAAKLAWFMLDTISDDCLYLREDAVRDLWDWTADHADALIFNSPYSMAKYGRRFAIAPDALQIASYHSLDVEDYRMPAPGRDAEPVPLDGPFLLVVGNHFQHKGIGMALDCTDALAIPRVLVGAKLTRPNLASFEAGRLNRGEIALLYERAAAVLFPSLYEGFGFPLMEGIAAGKPVIAHRNELTLDIARRLGAPPNLRLFGAFAEVPRLVAEALERPRSRPERPCGPAGGTRPAGDGWDRSVEEILGALDAVRRKPLSFERILRRQKAAARLG